MPDLQGVLMDTDEGRSIWDLEPPGPDDIIAIDDDRDFLDAALPAVFIQLKVTRGERQRTGRVFCFVDPDDAMARLGLLTDSTIPRLILVDMIFGVAERGPEIINYIRRRSSHCAIVGYSAQSKGSDLLEGRAALDGAAASEVGADEWFDKAALLNDDFFLDPVQFVSCIARAVERRQHYVRQLEATVARMQSAMLEWKGVLSRTETLSSITREALRVDFERIFGDPARILLSPMDEPTIHYAVHVGHGAARASRLLSVGGSTGATADQELQNILSAVVQVSASGGDILAANSADANRTEKLAQVDAYLARASNLAGEIVLAERLRKLVADLGREGEQHTVRSLAYLCRPWCDTRKQSLPPSSDAAAALIGLSIFLMAAQGQAAAELGLTFEAENYLSVAATDAQQYDIPFVQRFAQMGLRRLSQLAG